jgi:hypothetical protein
MWIPVCVLRTHVRNLRLETMLAQKPIAQTLTAGRNLKDP